MILIRPNGRDEKGTMGNRQIERSGPSEARAGSARDVMNNPKFSNVKILMTLDHHYKAENFIISSEVYR